MLVTMQWLVRFVKDRSPRVLAILTCVACNGDPGSTSADGNGGASSGGANGFAGGGGAAPSAGGTAGSAGSAGSAGGLSENQKRELWGGWSWFWDGQTSCSAPYSSSTDMTICHTDAGVYV